MPRILIAGCGYVGTALGLLLARDGHEVWGLRRAAERIPSPIRAIAADVAAGTSALASALPPALESVFYTAAAAGADDDAYRAAYVSGVENLLTCLAGRSERPCRFWLASSTSVYAQAAGEWVDEESETGSATFAARRLLEGEAIAAAAPFATTVVRFAGIYGPGRTHLIDRARSGQPRAPGPHYTNRIHRDDCAGALAHLMRLPAPLPLYLAVDREPADEGEVLAWLADRLGVKEPPVDPGLKRPPRLHGGSKRCSSSRLVASGYRFRYPTYREGYGALLAQEPS